MVSQPLTAVSAKVAAEPVPDAIPFVRVWVPLSLTASRSTDQVMAPPPALGLKTNV